MKTKTAKETLEVFKDILNSTDEKPLILMSDKGLEVQNSLFRKFCNSQQIKLITNQTSFKAPFVERFQRTLQRIIYQWCTDHETFTFYDKVQDFVSQYNKRHHRMIGLPPEIAELPSSQGKLALMNEKYLSKFFKSKRKNEKFKVGDHVRIRKERDIFFKGYKPRFKEEVLKYVFCIMSE